MRPGLVISWAVVLPAIVTAQQMIPGAEIPLTPPGYKMLRFDEDYSSLTNPANRTDLVDPVKYIPLRKEHPLWYLTIGGEVRGPDEGHYDSHLCIGRQKGRFLFAAAHHSFDRCASGRTLAIFRRRHFWCDRRRVTAGPSCAGRLQRLSICVC